MNAYKFWARQQKTGDAKIDANCVDTRGHTPLGGCW